MKSVDLLLQNHWAWWKKRNRGNPTRHGALPELRSELNVTPLVDIVLVLLIVFMVATPVVFQNQSIELPETTQHTTKQAGTALVLSLACKETNGACTQATLSFKGQPLSLIELPEYLRAERKSGTNNDLQLQADRRLSYSAVEAVLVVLDKQGYQGLTLTSKTKKPAEAAHGVQ